MKRQLTLLLALASLTASAGDKKAKVLCPSVSEDANAILNTLEQIQLSIKSSEECKTISENISSLGNLLTSDKWKKYKSVVNGDEDSNIEGAEIEELQSVTKSATNSIAQIVELIGGNKSCVSKKAKGTTLGSISSIVKEISTVVGNVSGPYSYAVSLTGGLLSEAIDGIDKIFKSNRPYNFNNINEEILFMNQFCSFVEAKKDVKDYLGMVKRKDELLKLDKYLKEKKTSMIENCSLCSNYHLASNAKLSFDKILKGWLNDQEIVEINSISGKRPSISRCNRISKEVYTQGSHLSKIYALLNQYENPGMSLSDREYIKQISSVQSVLKKVYPNSKTCAQLNTKEKSDISYMFNDFLRDDILPLNDSIFGAQLRGFRFLANKKYKKPLGDYIANTIDREIWVKKELKVIDKKVKDSLKPENREPIIARDIKLTRRMTEQLMPVYIKHLIKRNQNTLKKFTRDFNRFKQRDPDFKRLAKLMDKSIDSRSYLSRQRVLTAKLDLALAQSDKLKKYCEYLKYVASRTSKTDLLCNTTAKKITALYKILSKEQKHLKLMQKYDNWSDLNVETLSSRVADYATKIDDWNKLGDERWQEYDPNEQSVEEAMSSEQNDWLNTDPFSKN